MILAMVMMMRMMTILVVGVKLVVMSLNVQMLNIDLGKAGIASGTTVEWEYASHNLVILVIAIIAIVALNRSEL